MDFFKGKSEANWRLIFSTNNFCFALYFDFFIWFFCECETLIIVPLPVHLPPPLSLPVRVCVFIYDSIEKSDAEHNK